MKRVAALSAITSYSSGVDTANLGAAISRVSLELTRHAATLVRGQPELEVNGEVVSVGEVSRQRFLDAARPGDPATEGVNPLARVADAGPVEGASELERRVTERPGA